MYARLVPAALRSAAPQQPSRWIDALWASAAWRLVKRLLDVLMIFAVVGAVGWAATNGVFVAQRAFANRAIAQVHLANGPVVLQTLDGAGIRPTVLHQGIRHGQRTVRVSIRVENEGPDGVTLRSATLSGPYLAASALLQRSGSGYVGMRAIAALSGTVTVDCDAAAGVSGALVAMSPVPRQAPTLVALTVDDANGNAHQVTMTLDTTASALQGQVCVS